MSASPSHNNLRDAVFCQKLPVARPTRKETFDAAVGEGALNGKGRPQLYFQIVTRRHMKPAMDCLFAMGPCVEEGQHLPSPIHRRKQMSDHGRNLWFGNVVQCRPQQRHIKCAPGKIERLLEKAADIPNGIVVLILARLPISGAGIMDQIGKKDAMAEAGEVVDVDRRRVADVDDAEAWLSLKPGAQSSPASRVTRHSGPDEPLGGSCRAALLFLLKPSAKQPEYPSRSNRSLRARPNRGGCSKVEGRLRRRGAIVPLDDVLRQVYSATEYRVILHREAERADIPFYVAAGAQFHTAAGNHIAF